MTISSRLRISSICLASALAFAGVHWAGAVATAGDGTVPFKETLDYLGNDVNGVAHYSGTATHLGNVTAVQFFNPDFDPNDPDSVFSTYVKYGANGDSLYGNVIPDDPANPFTTGH